MALKKKTQNPLATPGGGAKGGSTGTGGSVRVKPGGVRPPKPKPAKPSGPTMRSTAKDKPLTKKEQAAGNKRGLKAAKGGSLAPAGYGPDYARRAALKEYKAAKYPMTGAQMDSLKKAKEVMSGPGPKNVLSKSGRSVKNPNSKEPKSNPRKPLLTRITRRGGGGMGAGSVKNK